MKTKESRATWNVSLWINNDEGLYRLAKQAIRRTANRAEAVEYLYDILGNEKTPDGYRYTKTGLRAALVGME